MICVSIAEKKVEDLVFKLRDLEFAEVRLEYIEDLSDVEIDTIFKVDAQIIATMRPGNHMDDRRRHVLCRAIDAGAYYVDIEHDADADYRDTIIQVARERGCKVIISYHNLEKTPSAADLSFIMEECFQMGADVAKLACFVNAPKDNARILSLLRDHRPVVVVGMGPLGKISRVASMFMGAAFTFASYKEGEETADGQMDVVTMSSLIAELQR